MKRIIQFFSLIILFQASSAFASWSENMRLTYRGFEISPQIIVRNDTIHIAWFQVIINNISNVSYIRSTDGGATWDSIINLNATGHRGQYSNLNLDENGLLVSWFDYNDDENISSIAISKSVTGASWTAPTYVWTDNPNRFGLPVSAVKGDSIFLAYFSNRDDSTGQSPFRSMHSYDYGQTWSDEVTVGHPFSSIIDLTMAYCQGALLVVFTGSDSLLHTFHILGYRSVDAGRNWAGWVTIDPDPDFVSELPQIACNCATGQIAVGYLNGRYTHDMLHGDIFVSISEDGGQTWPRETRCTTGPNAYFESSISYFVDTLIAIWPDKQFYDQGLHEIVLRRSNSAGDSWLNEERITNTNDESVSPWISYDSGRINVAWIEDVDSSGYEVFFKQYTPDSTDAIDNNEIFVPANLSLSAYPNPFNSATTITLIGAEQAEIGIYDITGRMITTLHTSGGQALWDASGVSSGLYFARVVGAKASTIKLVLLK